MSVGAWIACIELLNPQVKLLVTLGFGPLARNDFLASDLFSMILGELDPLTLVE